MNKENAAEGKGWAWKFAFINAFIILQLYVIVFWGMPGSNIRNTMVRMVETYVIKIGLWHSWDMFSPDPLAVNFNLEAYITFADGTIKVWEFPRMEKMGMWKRYQKERFRKWRERVRQDSYKIVWEDTARYIARLVNDPKNPPVRIALVRHWAPIPAPESAGRKGGVHDYQPIPKEYKMSHSYRFFTYEVRREDL